VEHEVGHAEQMGEGFLLNAVDIGLQLGERSGGIGPVAYVRECGGEEPTGPAVMCCIWACLTQIRAATPLGCPQP
jgi:hypothetical protein